MTPFQPAVVSPEETELMVQSFLKQWREGGNILLRDCKSEDDVRRLVEHANDGYQVFLNDTYQVAVRRGTKPLNKEDLVLTHLSIKRIDRKPIHDWRDLQTIKNMLVGEECEAVELYPAESRKVDSANQFHLWCIEDPTFRFPIGFNEGRYVTDEPGGKAVNRPL